MILEIKWVFFNWLPLVRNFKPLGGSTKWGLADGVGQWEPTMFKGKKKQKGVRQKLWATVTQSIKAVFGVEILDIRPPPWVWDATSVPCSLGSTYGLCSCKRFERNWPIPPKPHFLNFSHKLHGLGSCLKE